MVDLVESLTQVTWFKEFSGGYLCKCPFAPKTHSRGYDRTPSLVMYPESNFFQCYSCGQKGNLSYFFTKLAELIPHPVHEELAAKWQDSLWHVTYKLREKPKTEKVYLSEEILEHFPPLEDFSYIQSRKIDKAAAIEYDLRMDHRSNRVVFPVRDTTGGLLGFVGRHTERKEQQGVNCE